MRKQQFYSVKALIWGIALLILIVLGYWAQQKLPHMLSNANKPDLLAADFIAPAIPVQSFMLQGEHEQIFNEKNLLGHWTFIFFGFTQCPELCPTTLATMNQAFTELQNKHQLHHARLWFVSIDPARDDSAALMRYTGSFNRHFIGVTGNAEQLAQLTKQFGIVYMKVAAQDKNTSLAHNYNIDHSGAILLINPQAQLQAIFSLPHNADKIAHDFEQIATSYSRL